MKTLLVLRHAKSSWAEAGLSDFERPLNDRGRRDAPRIGKLLRREGLTPVVVFSSTAVRALTTAHLVLESSECDAELIERGDLYLAPAAQYLAALHELDDSVPTALVIGHNPGLQQLVSRLSGEPHDLPTAALAWFELPIDSWSETSLAPSGQLRQLWRPRTLDEL